MKSNKPDIELIERFLDNELSENERADFEKKLKKEKDFSDLYLFRTKIANEWRNVSEYEKTKRDIGYVIRYEKKRKKRLAIYSIAAILVVCLILPLTIPKYQKKGSLAESKSVHLHINNPGNKASVHFFDEKYIQKFPINNQTFEFKNPILFKWNSGLNVNTAIIIKEQHTNSIIRHIPISSIKKHYRLKEELPKGNYFWQLEGFNGNLNFSVK